MRDKRLLALIARRSRPPSHCAAWVGPSMWPMWCTSLSATPPPTSPGRRSLSTAARSSAVSRKCLSTKPTRSCDAHLNAAGHGGLMVKVMSGYRVVDVGMWTFGPLTGGVLADWGAAVVKIEHPVTGDPPRGLVTSDLFKD